MVFCGTPSHSWEWAHRELQPEVKPTVSLVVHFHSRGDLAQRVDFQDPSLSRVNCIPPEGYKVNKLDNNSTGGFLEGGVVIVLIPFSLMTCGVHAQSPLHVLGLLQSYM